MRESERERGREKEMCLEKFVRAREIERVVMLMRNAEKGERKFVFL